MQSFRGVLSLLQDALGGALESGAPPALMVAHAQASAKRKKTAAASICWLMQEAFIRGWCRGRGGELVEPPR